MVQRCFSVNLLLIKTAINRINRWLYEFQYFFNIKCGGLNDLWLENVDSKAVFDDFELLIGG